MVDGDDKNKTPEPADEEHAQLPASDEGDAPAGDPGDEASAQVSDETEDEPASGDGEDEAGETAAEVSGTEPDPDEDEDEPEPEEDEPEEGEPEPESKPEPPKPSKKAAQKPEKKAAQKSEKKAAQKSEKRSDKKAPSGKPLAPEGPSEERIDLLKLQPSEEGIFADAGTGWAFGTEPDELDGAEELAFRRKRNMLSMAIIVVVALITVGGGFVIWTDEVLRQDLTCFISGTIEECKTAEKKRLQRHWFDEDIKSRNKYGDVELVYFPQDAQVRIHQVKYEQAGLNAIRKPVGETEIKNKSLELAAGETVERLPLTDLAIFESLKADDGSVSMVFTFEYRFEFSREGYKTRSITLRETDWQRIGPGNLVYQWPGLDLVPEPETVKANFAKAMGEVFCLMKLKGIEDWQAVPEENFELIRLRNGFKTDEDFRRAHDYLTVGDFREWWKAEWEKIQQVKCVE